LKRRTGPVWSRVSLRSSIRGSAQRVSLTEGVLDLDESKLGFSATAKDFSKPDLAFDLSLDKIDLDRYLPPPTEKPGKSRLMAKKTPRRN
jgi:AsmA protein